MVKPFDEDFFPGKAGAKGKAQVIEDDFDPIAAPPVPDIEESVASLEDEYIPRPPPPKSRLSLREDSPSGIEK